jgi:exonuclease SbcD
MYLLLVQDIHFSDKGPLSRKDNYTQSVIEKFNQIIEISNKLGVEALIVAGDTFHAKQPAKNSHYLVNTAMKIFNQFKNVYLIAGNHDISFYGVDNLDFQPLGTLFSNPKNKLLDTNPQIVDCGDFSVELCGISFVNGDIRPIIKNLPKRVSKYRILVTHQLILPSEESFDFGNEIILTYKDLSSGDYDFDILFNGHTHMFYPTNIINGKYFISPGALTRGSIHADEIVRIPRIVLLDITKDKLSVTEIKIDVKPYQDIFDIEKHESVKKEKEDIDKFINSIVESSYSHTYDVFSYLEKLSCESESVKELAFSILREMELKVKV